jgi:hypothetical protein
MRLARDDNVVEAFAPDRSDQPFGKTVLPRRRRCSGLVANAHSVQSARNDGAIDAIPGTLSGAGMQSILWTRLMSQTSAIGRIECKKMTIKRKYAAPDDNSQGIFSQRPLALEAEGRADVY